MRVGTLSLILVFSLICCSPAVESADPERRSTLFATAPTAAETFSSGCNQTPPRSPPTSLGVDGRERSFISYIPENHDGPKKLIFAFHGRTNPNAQVRQYYDLERHGQDTAIIVYPSGLVQADGTFSWSDPGDPADDLRDYALFDALLATFSDLYCLDLDHVYVVGHSLGAWFANSLACARGHLIRAAATVAGGIARSECTGLVAAMLLHNPEDEHVPFSAGIAARDSYLAQNQCADASVATEPRRLGCERYEDCREGYLVVWCPHLENYDYRGVYYPHQWPTEAGAFIWEFFRALE